MVDVAQENYLADLEAGTEGLIEPLLFNDVFGPCMNTPDLNRLACLSEEADEVDGGVVLSPIRARNSYYTYEWEPTIVLPATSEGFERNITGGIYKVENDQPIFADAGISIGAYAPYFKTRRQLEDLNECDANTDNCGDILVITYVFDNVTDSTVVSGTDTAEAAFAISQACLDALGGFCGSKNVT